MKTDTQLLQEIQRLATAAAARSEVLGSALYVDVEAILAATNILLGSLSSQGYDVEHLILHKSQLPTTSTTW
jgi:hypothetical protein